MRTDWQGQEWKLAGRLWESSDPFCYKSLMMAGEDLLCHTNHFSEDSFWRLFSSCRNQSLSNAHWRFWSTGIILGPDSHLGSSEQPSYIQVNTWSSFGFWNTENSLRTPPPPSTARCSYTLMPCSYVCLFLWATDTTWAREKNWRVLCTKLCDESCGNVGGSVFALEAAAAYGKRHTKHNNMCSRY